MSQSTISHSIKNEVRETLTLGFPLVFSQLIYASSSFIGTAFVAQLGEDALAASVLVSTIWMTLSVLFFGILNAISVLVAHQHGAKNYKAIDEIMGQSFLLGIFMIVVMILILFTMPFFLHLSMQPPQVLKLAYQYMYSLMWTIPALILLIICEQFLAGINRAKMVLRISLIVVPIEIPLIYLLIFGKFGLPACGVAGVGYGFAITYTLTAIFLIYYLTHSANFKKYHIFSGMKRFNLRYFKEIIKVGSLMGIMHVIELSTFMVIAFWIARFGTTMLAAHQIVLQYLNFAITLVFAMSQAVTVRVGHAVGKHDLSGIYYASYIGLFLNFICVACISYLLYLLPVFFLRLDVNVNDPTNAELISAASTLLRIAVLSLFFDSFRIIGFGALRGLKDTKYPIFSAILGLWGAGLPVGYILGFKFQLGGAGIWWGDVAGVSVAALIVLVRLHYLLKHTDVNTLVQHTEVFK